MVQVGVNDQYVVKVGVGSGSLTLQKRKHLRKVECQKSLWEPGIPYVAEHRPGESNSQCVEKAGQSINCLQESDSPKGAPHPVNDIEATPNGEEA